MGSTTSATPDPTDASRRDQPAVPGGSPLQGPASGAEPLGAGTGSHPHDFEAQKRIHQQIRNDPDYDDWDYGTEPLPHEAWGTGRSPRQTPPVSPAPPQPVAEGTSPGG